MISVSFIRKIHGLAILGLMVAASSLAVVAPAYAVDQGGLGGKPAYPKDNNIRSQSIFVHTLDPNEQATDGVQVINNTDETKNIMIYAVDSQASSDGAFACAQAADKPVSVGKWVTMEKSELTLAAGESQVVDFTVTAPKDASPGEHNGCIVIQDTESQPASGSNGIVLSLRSAIRLIVTVPGDIQKGLVFTGLDMQPKNDQKLLLSAALKNNGNVSLDTLIDVTLTYPWGATASKVGGSFPILSSTESRFNFETDRPFWGGWYRLSATAQYNDNPGVPIGEGAPNASVARDTWIFVAPMPIAAAIEGAILVLLIGGTYWFVTRHLRHKKAIASATQHIVTNGEDLHSIAKAYDMSWKYLARINKLKAPYSLKTGQTLSVIPPNRNITKQNK